LGVALVGRGVAPAVAHSVLLVAEVLVVLATDTPIYLSRRGKALKSNRLTFAIRASDSSWHSALPGRHLFPRGSRSRRARRCACHCSEMVLVENMARWRAGRVSRVRNPKLETGVQTRNWKLEKRETRPALPRAFFFFITLERGVAPAVGHSVLSRPQLPGNVPDLPGDRLS